MRLLREAHIGDANEHVVGSVAPMPCACHVIGGTAPRTARYGLQPAAPFRGRCAVVMASVGVRAGVATAVVAVGAAAADKAYALSAEAAAARAEAEARHAAAQAA